MLKCSLKTEDETRIFQEVLKSLNARAPAEMAQIISQLDEVTKKRIRKLLMTTQVEYMDESGNQHKIARRIVRVARRTQQPAPTEQ